MKINPKSQGPNCSADFSLFVAPDAYPLVAPDFSRAKENVASSFNWTEKYRPSKDGRYDKNLGDDL